MWTAFRRNPTAHAGSPWLERRLEETARDIGTLRVPYDEWQIVYGQALQLGPALRGEGIAQKGSPMAPSRRVPRGGDDDGSEFVEW